MTTDIKHYPDNPEIDPRFKDVEEEFTRAAMAGDMARIEELLRAAGIEPVEIRLSKPQDKTCSTETLR